jgi:four helix bundle protein
VREAEFAESILDFIHKMAIGQKEINETIYWLELLNASEYLSNQEFESINTDAKEILRLITASIKTAKKRVN